MFDNLWVNLTVATMAEGAPADNPYGIINNAALGVKGNKIVFVGPASDLPKKPEQLTDYLHDCEGRLVTPGLIDCHTHLAYAGDRAEEFEKRLNGATYEDIARAGGGIVSTVNATRAASESEIFELTMARFRKLAFEGVTTVEVKSGYGLDLENERKLLRVAARLADETGFRVKKTFLGAHAVPPEFKGRADDYIDAVCKMIPDLATEGLVDAVDAFCDNIGFTPAQTRKVFEAAKAAGLPVKLHAEQLTNQHGAELAAEYGALSADHLEHLDEDGAKAMAETGMVAVLLPGAFYYLRDKTLPPIELLRKHKVPMAVATDHNPGTSPTLSPLLMLNMACTLFRLTPVEALAGMTRVAAKALGLQAEIGTLEKGKIADAVLWDLAHPRELCYYFGNNPAYGAIVAGEWTPFAYE